MWADLGAEEVLKTEACQCCCLGVRHLAYSLGISVELHHAFHLIRLIGLT